MWLKVDDDLLIALLGSIPRPWPAEAVLVWLAYCSRCVEPTTAGIKALATVYWVPSWASDKAKTRAEARRFPGRAALMSVAGIGSGTAQRLLKKARVKRNYSVDHSVDHSGKTPRTPASTTPVPENHSVDHSVDHSGASRGKSPKARARADSREANSRTDKTTYIRARRSGRRNLAAPAQERGFQPTDEQVDRSWAHIASLCHEHPRLMPRTLHELSATHTRLLQALQALGSGDRREGWRRAVELRQRGEGLLADDGTPAEWTAVFAGEQR